MKKIIAACLMGGLTVGLASSLVLAHICEAPLVTDLIAGGGNPKSAMDVGEVTICNDDEYLYVTYVVTEPGWCLMETHLDVATSPTDIPQVNGNPVPGRFTYGKDDHDCINSYTIPVPLTWAAGTPLFVAAHGVVQGIECEGDLDLEEFAATLPDQVLESVEIWYSGGPAYFPVVTVTDGDSMAGFYEGWCIDTDHLIGPNIVYPANVYSSYEALPSGLIEYPENIDLVNWIINSDLVGKNIADVFPETTCTGTITFGDVQGAIWMLLEDNYNISLRSLGPYSLCRIQEIVEDATVNGEGFVPGCCDYVVLILAPVDDQGNVSAQLIILPVILSCLTDETAWGDGLPFSGKNWATYTPYEVQ